MAKSDDLLQIVALLRSKAEFDGGVGLLKASIEQIAAAFFGDRAWVSALVAELNGGLVGVATYFESYSTFLAEPCLWLDDAD